MMKATIKDLDLKGKTVLVRADFNVPLEDGKITNDKRITAALPTIKYIINAGGKVVLFSHLGRVKTEEDLETLSLLPVGNRLSEKLDQDVYFVNTTKGEELESAIEDLKNREVLLVENTRFEDLDGKKESKNDEALGKYWASLGDVFVNDAFGTAHRSHASNVGISEHLPAVSGFLIEKEIDFLGEAVLNPKRPLVAILGGAKVSDKITVIESLLEKADKILIGGGMANTFLRAQGYDTGKSLVEEDKLDLAKSLLEKGKDKLVLPVDVVAAKEFSNDSEHAVRDASEIEADEMALDVGPKTVELFEEVLKDAKTVVWNGPMGVFEMSNFAQGTIKVCESLAKLEDAITIIGGGDSATAAEQLGFEEDFTHISTGGGASLEFLEGKELPGIKALNDK
ncbi:phosphoglycerate kinase [Nosocomiicoccus massiliensis]|uniref:Phosphoglycerate kinase n=1 Tax=Nosocomiicoccus massiliensis TaxID=1232430 RepID=A0AAF1BW12_9STAP|nr:phosphoglycerate kinase [Nosocomiicoccus massiliensis]WOS97011.1 phosphoglycerate kinase [Nosocomiicoccus massiliensis]